MNWPMIDLALKWDCLDFIDCAFAEMALREFPEADEKMAGFICHLTLASREGHLCIFLEKNRLSPSPLDLWGKGKVLPEELVKFLETIPQGAKQLPSRLVNKMEQGFPDALICLCQNRYYLQKNWLYETLFLNQFTRLLQTEPQLKISLEKVQESVKNLKIQGFLNACQAEAVTLAFQNSLCVICGGPGTGKTYTAGQFIRLFWSLLDFTQQQCLVAVAAPTGKATSHLKHHLGRTEGVGVQAKTLHSLLGISSDYSGKFPPEIQLPYDLIVVDECSMIDVKLMGTLLSAIKPGARLILLGDPFQLPPIEAGSLFADMVKVLGEGLKVELKASLRAETSELIVYAEAIKQGTTPPDNHFVQVRDLDSKQVLDAVVEQFSFIPAQTDSPAAILDLFKKFRVLSPLRRGKFGANEINKALYHHFSRASVFPIMIVKNDYKRELFNGETGVLVRDGDYALFPGTQGVRKVPAALLPEFEYAYCLSVHKSQGSEFDRVFLLLPEGSEQFGREAVYTAATRARKELTIWGSGQVIAEALKKRSMRVSGVEERFKLPFLSIN